MMNIRKKAYEILFKLYGTKAEFRSGQFEAIEATLSHKRTLVVQKTGWGKSLVYFLSTKILREQGEGVTLVVSPLLVLMENQLESASRLGLKCDMLNYTTKDRHSEIIEQLKNDKLDVIFVTPETLFNDEVQKALLEIRIGLFVVDEAHCISDWGHDFRLKYCNLIKVIKNLPKSVPVLATTATANNRVIEDLKKQLGGDVFVSRGPLTRESLCIKVLYMPDRATRYAWLLKNINNLPGTGIIYCLTRRDCDYVSDFLNKHGISAMPYYSDDTKLDVFQEALEKFQNNEIKAIVATIKLGMGYDKGDIGFIIHYQCPPNIISYYQQIGRAGRNIDKAIAILMYGKEDRQINNYFIETAFPQKADCEKVLEILRKNDGLKKSQIKFYVNIENREIEKVLMFLENEGAIFYDSNKYFASSKDYVYNEEHYNEIKKAKKTEMEQMVALLNTKECYSKFIVNCLDDFSTKNCGKCSNCLGESIFDNNLTVEDVEEALKYVNGLLIKFSPRKQWPNKNYSDKLAIEYINQEGIALCKYGEAGYGELVKKDKYENKQFCDELLGKSVEVLKKLVKENEITALTFVPSLRSDIVKDFAERLAKRLNLELIDSLQKSEAREQKNMKNSAFQCDNAFNSFHIKEGVSLPKNILLVDDMVDSKWTFTVCGYRLMENRAEKVFQFALADSSRNEV